MNFNTDESIYQVSSFIVPHTMVALMCKDGIVIAINRKDCLIYNMDDRIYCCGASSGRDRDIIINVSSFLDSYSRAKGVDTTIEETLELLCASYKKCVNVNAIVAGEDDKGLQLYEIDGGGNSNAVYFAAKGKGAIGANPHLAQYWRKGMSLCAAESLAKAAINVADASEAADLEQELGIETCVIMKSKSPPTK